MRSDCLKKSCKSDLKCTEKILADIKQRGDETFWDEWEELRQEIFTPKEIAEVDLRTKKIVNALSKKHARKKQIIKSLNFLNF